jgi:hypothetical protein
VKGQRHDAFSLSAVRIIPLSILLAFSRITYTSRKIKTSDLLDSDVREGKGFLFCELESSWRVSETVWPLTTHERADCEESCCRILVMGGQVRRTIASLGFSRAGIRMHPLESEKCRSLLSGCRMSTN